MLRFLTAGESHGPSLTAILDGIPAGLALPAQVIDRELERRQQGYGSGGRMKIEKDAVEILGGVMAGETTGAPIALQVMNADHVKWKGKAIEPLTSPRPGHADLTGAVKYGYRDLRPALERASARETTMRVAAGAVCKHFLMQFGIVVGGYVRAIGEINSDPDDMPYLERFERAERSDVRCPNEEAAQRMRARIEEIIHGRDTLGGILEIVALGVPAGLGSYAQWDRRIEARLAMALMSVQAMKGVEIGDAFENSRLPGTKAHDSIRLSYLKKGAPQDTQGHFSGEGNQSCRGHRGRCDQWSADCHAGRHEADCHNPHSPNDGGSRNRPGIANPIRTFGFLPGAARSAHPRSHGGFCAGGGAHRKTRW